MKFCIKLFRKWLTGGPRFRSLLSQPVNPSTFWTTMGTNIMTHSMCNTLCMHKHPSHMPMHTTHNVFFQLDKKCFRFSSLSLALTHTHTHTLYPHCPALSKDSCAEVKKVITVRPTSDALETYCNKTVTIQLKLTAVTSFPRQMLLSLINCVALCILPSDMTTTVPNAIGQLNIPLLFI